MKDVHFSSDSNEWETPQQFFDELDKEFHFNLDVCATKENAKCWRYFTKENDGLEKDWGMWFYDVKRAYGHYGGYRDVMVKIKKIACWMNPPYGREIGKWMKKAYEESRKRKVKVVCLVPSRTDTKWWHDYAMKGKIRFLKGRLYFSNNGKSGRAPFPSAIVIFK